MVQLSQDERILIAEHPLNDTLDHLQDPLRRAEQSYKQDCISYDGTADDPQQGSVKVISRLLNTLQGHEAAFDLRSKTGYGDVASELSTLFNRVRNGDFSYEHYYELSRLVIRKAPDADIWNAVFDLIHKLSRLTPPPSRPPFASSFQQTPWTFNTGGFEDTSEHRKYVDDVLRAELTPSLRIDIPDFVNAVFGSIPRLDELSKILFDHCQKEDTPVYIEGSGWAKWPVSAKENLVLDWLQEVVNHLIRWATEKGLHAEICRRIYRGPNTYLDGSTIKRKMDVGIVAYEKSKNNVEKSGNSDPTWSQILVAGELKSNSIEDRQETAWLSLATYVREVFRTQERRFVLGFTLCGPMMRLWQFDRSGSSGSSSFNINQDGLKFVQIMLGYHMMNNEQLGLDPTIQRSSGRRYTEITRDDQVERLFLTEEIRKQAAVVGRTTTCWRAYRVGDDSKKPLIVKDSWQYVERPEEGELIKEATEKGVVNIARYYHHETVQVDGKIDDTIENVRRGLMKTCGRTAFRQQSFTEPGSQTWESTREITASQSQSQNDSRKRSSDSAQMPPPPSKRSCSSLQSKSIEKPLHNRVHRRVITRDPGRPIHGASSRAAVVRGFIGAISGHESLLNAGILHRDVSIGNIMLNEKEDDGFLIDLDLAIKTDDEQASGAPSKTGTKVFMAIGALFGDHHTFMHDLESFFWVLFWICIHYGGLDNMGKVRRRVVSKYENWNYNNLETLALNKKGIIDDESDFERCIEQDFTAYFKPLAPYVNELRRKVFPNNQRWKTEDKRLYSDMKAILKKALKNLDESNRSKNKINTSFV